MAATEVLRFEPVGEVAFCARHAREERSLIAARPKRPDPFGLSKAAVALTRILPIARAQENREAPIHIDFNDLGEPTELRIGNRRYRVYPRGV